MNIQMNEPHGIAICDNYFISSYCLNINVMHYLNMEVACMIFMCKQHE
jgi:hypothetical protein